MIGSVNWYDGMEGSWFWCVAVCEGSVWTCGVIPVLRLRSMRAMVRGDIHAVLSVCKDWV